MKTIIGGRHKKLNDKAKGIDGSLCKGIDAGIRQVL